MIYILIFNVLASLVVVFDRYFHIVEPNIWDSILGSLGWMAALGYYLAYSHLRNGLKDLEKGLEELKEMLKK